MATPSKKAANTPGPLISVVIPAYNTRETIAEAIDSVLVQSYSNLEIIVIDDGSPDDVATHVEQKYGSKVQLIRQQNVGLAGARNTGIQAAKGEYVAFLDSDDAWLPNKLAEQVKQISKHPDGTVFYSNCYFWENGKRTKQWIDIHNQGNGVITRKLIRREIMIPVLTTVVKKSALTEAGHFNQTLREVEDYDLWLRLAIQGATFYGSAKPLALYRINPKGLSSNTLKMAKTQLQVYKRLLADAPSEFTVDIKQQVVIFSVEVLHQRRRQLLASGKHMKAAQLSLAMIRHQPTRFLHCTYAAIAILLGSKKYL